MPGTRACPGFDPGPGMTSRRPRLLVSNRLGHHRDGAARAFLGANPAPFAEIVVELESVARPELDHRVVRTHAVTVVAFETVAARKATPRLVQRVGFVEPFRHFLESRAAPRHLQRRPYGFRRVRVVPGVELVEGRDLVPG